MIEVWGLLVRVTELPRKFMSSGERNGVASPLITACDCCRGSAAARRRSADKGETGASDDGPRICNIFMDAQDARRCGSWCGKAGLATLTVDDAENLRLLPVLPPLTSSGL